MPATEPRTEPVTARFAERERRLVEAAARLRGSSVSSWIREQATEAALEEIRSTASAEQKAAVA